MLLFSIEYYLAQWLVKFYQQRVKLQTSWIMKHVFAEKEKSENWNVIHSINFNIFPFLKNRFYSRGQLVNIGSENGVEIMSLLIDQIQRKSVINSIYPHPEPINMSINPSGRHSSTEPLDNLPMTQRGLLVHSICFAFAVEFFISFIYYWNLRID